MIKRFEAGDGTTAVLNTITRTVKLKSNGGTLWPDWLERVDIDRNSIYTIYTKGTIYAPENMRGFDTENGKFRMFGGLRALDFLDMTGIDTSRVTNMRSMFEFCKKLEYLDLSNFDTSNTTCMDGMFSRCFNLKELNMNGADMGKITSMRCMFSSCRNLKNIIMNPIVKNDTKTREIFRDCPAQLVGNYEEKP